MIINRRLYVHISYIYHPTSSLYCNLLFSGEEGKPKSIYLMVYICLSIISKTIINFCKLTLLFFVILCYFLLALSSLLHLLINLKVYCLSSTMRGKSSPLKHINCISLLRTLITYYKNGVEEAGLQYLLLAS